MTDAAVEREQPELSKRRWIVASTLLNSVLASAKLAWGLVSGSTVVLADAIHSLSDVIGALLVYGAVRLAPRRSARFPLGLYKLEDMAAVAGGIGVLFAGYEILRSVFFDSGVASPSMPVVTLWFMTAVVLVQAIFYRAEKRAAKELHSPGLNSDVVNWLGDLGASLVVMAGIAGHLLGIPRAQEVAVVVIAALIFQGAYEVIRDGLLSLLDASVAEDEMQQARDYLESLPLVDRVQSLRIRRAGSALFLNATLELEPQGFSQAHRMVDDIAEELRRRIPRLESVTLHYEPVHSDLHRRVTLFGADRTAPADAFGKAVWLRLEDIDADGGTTSQQWFRNPYLEETHGKAMKLAAWLVRNRVDEVRFDAAESPQPLIELLSTLGIQVNKVNT